MSVLEDLQQSVRSIVERAGPSVVGIRGGWRGGSGIVTADGTVLTNAHVVRRGDPTLRLADGSDVAATIAAADVDTDLAVLRADGLPAGLAWRPVDEPVELGLPVFALAATRGGGLHASLGLVSSTGRSFRGARGRKVTGTVEHTAPLPRGSSGSALVDAQGRLVGINTLRLDGGLILAVAADAAIRERVDALGRGEAPNRIVLGVGLAPARVARRLRAAVGLPPRDGLLVRQGRGRLPCRRCRRAAGRPDRRRRRPRVDPHRRPLRGARRGRPGRLPRPHDRPRCRRARPRDPAPGADRERRMSLSPSLPADDLEQPSEAEALEAYSQVVMRVAERLSPSVASLRVIVRRGAAAARSRPAPAAPSRSRPTASCSPRPTSSAAAAAPGGPRSRTAATTASRSSVSTRSRISRS